MTDSQLLVGFKFLIFNFKFLNESDYGQAIIYKFPNL